MSNLYNELTCLLEAASADVLELQRLHRRQPSSVTEDLVPGQRMIKTLLIGILCGAAALTIGILIGHFGITKSGSSAPPWLQDVAKDVDESLIETFLSEVNTLRIEENLRELTRVPHMATTAGDERTVQLMLKRWQDPETGLDRAWREEYLVYLSFPDPKKPNKVTVVGPSGDVLHAIREKEKPYTAEQEDPEVVQPYAAYSPAGHAKGKLVYANQGTPSDYERLNQTVDLAGTIAITRYGGAGRGAKAVNAAPYGVAGVLVYTDPRDINDGVTSDAGETYPHSWYLPPSGVERGSFNGQFGDLLTPYLAAKEDTYRIPAENVTGIPPIPIQPIGYEDAYVLICALDGDAAPQNWQGGFNCTYNLGPGFKPTSAFSASDVQMDIFNYEEKRNSSNVMGVIRGSVEPGEAGPKQTARIRLGLCSECVRVHRQVRDLWEPQGQLGARRHRPEQRDLGHAGAEPRSGPVGEAGQMEAAQVHHLQQLGSRGVRTHRICRIHRAILHQAQRTHRRLHQRGHRCVWSPLPDECPPPCMRTGCGSPTEPARLWDSSPDWATSREQGATTRPSCTTWESLPWTSHTHTTGLKAALGPTPPTTPHTTPSTTPPGSSTQVRTHVLLRECPRHRSTRVPSGFLSHQAVARTAGNVLIRVADSLLLPLNCSDYAETLEQYLTTAESLYQEQLSAQKIPMEPLKRAVANFRSAASHLDRVIGASDLKNETPLKVRRINDQLMLLDRAFLNPLAFPEKYAYRHVIWASSSAGQPTFPGLADAYAQAESSGQSRDWERVHYQLSVLTQSIDGAAQTLVDVI
ncbi:aminopeptidase NAALADL1 isoform X2 [Betta splendens]|uniref:Aminopeptidase NAALADL1 isoform X2 n=1 Tax=Betta splendens TaxID=158456 RepID=A0A9W2Y1C9_BETSP|nr:aminopeptidase NAALADL1 isoform X2 [Betta splendens]